MEHRDPKQALGRLLGPAGPEVGCDGVLRGARPLRRARARRRRRRRGDPRAARAPRRLPCLPRGAREPARARRRRAGALGGFRRGGRLCRLGGFGFGSRCRLRAVGRRRRSCAALLAAPAPARAPRRLRLGEILGEGSGHVVDRAQSLRGRRRAALSHVGCSPRPRPARPQPRAAAARAPLRRASQRSLRGGGRVSWRVRRAGAWPRRTRRWPRDPAPCASPARGATSIGQGSAPVRQAFPARSPAAACGRPVGGPSPRAAPA